VSRPPATPLPARPASVRSPRLCPRLCPLATAPLSVLGCARRTLICPRSPMSSSCSPRAPFARRLSSFRSPVVLVSLAGCPRLARPSSVSDCRARRSLTGCSRFPCLVLVLSSVRYSSSSRARFPVPLPGSRPFLSPVLLLVSCPVPGYPAWFSSSPQSSPPPRSVPGSRFPSSFSSRFLSLAWTRFPSSFSSRFPSLSDRYPEPSRPSPVTGRQQ